MPRLAVLLLLLVSGCAALATPEPSGQRFVVFFSEWSAAIDPSAEAAIRSAAEAAAKTPAAAVAVTGFADTQGSAEANRELSRTRAQVVYDQLVHDGVAPARIVRGARGEVDFALSSQQSRRVEITVGAP